MYIHVNKRNTPKGETRMLDTRFGVEIEMTGLSRREAATVVKRMVKGDMVHTGGPYDEYTVTSTDGRVWKIVRDGSIRCQKKEDGVVVGANDYHSVEFVTPILTYKEDIDLLQEIVRALRKAGAIANSSCGIHIHVDGAGHTARTLRNFVNIIYARNDLFYKALGIESARARYCQKLDEEMVQRMNKRKPQSLMEIEDIWYNGESMYYRQRHYNNTRYHFLNLHSFFHGHHTVELRGFNSTLHAGEVRSYIVFALALNNQALTQKAASTKKPQIENEKFAMRTYLNRIGLIGDDFKACREHLTKKLSGSSAWRHGRTA